MKIYTYKGQRNLAGRRILEALETLHLSQRQMAAKLQVKEVMLDQKALSRIERQERFLSDFELLIIAEVLDVDVIWLLTGRGKGPDERPGQ